MSDLAKDLSGLPVTTQRLSDTIFTVELTKNTRVIILVAIHLSVRRNRAMASNRVKRVGTYVAKSSSGEKFAVQAFREIIDGSDSSGSDQPQGDLILRTADGGYVNYIGKGVYELVGAPNVEIRSDDPNAP
ncbi:MAG TPA: hypothetical protein VGM05_29210 [Planctomycetaceae bacterium]